MQRTAREGMNTFPEYKVVTLPQRPCHHMDLEALGKVTDYDRTQAIPSRPVFSKTWGYVFLIWLIIFFFWHRMAG